MTTLVVNGSTVSLPGDRSTTLLHALRNGLRLNGPKYGCGLGACGACTVLVDGVAARACMIPLAGVGGRSVTTLEGLADASGLHPVQQAFIDAQAAQCGYCINGMIMTAVALLSVDPEPTASRRCAQALSGNLCRCGTHLEIVDAVLRAAAAGSGARAMSGAADPTPMPMPAHRAGAPAPTALHATGVLLVTREPPPPAPQAAGQPPMVAGRPGRRRRDPGRRLRRRPASIGFNGHVDLGTGIRTALAQIVAEELDVGLDQVEMVLGDTALAPNQGPTIASASIQIHAVPLRQAAAQARASCWRWRPRCSVSTPTR